MRNKQTARVRGDWVPLARGVVLEIGIGSGLNLPFYSAEVSRIYGVEPSGELQKLARKRSLSKAIQVEFISQSAEEPLPLPDQSVDTLGDPVFVR
jgi:ubiquinone/menaquinone biosynthesis C-methylase UbiE